MNRMLAEKAFRLIFIFVFVAGTVWVPGTNAVAQMSSCPASMVSYWKGDGDALDSVNGNDGTLNGATYAEGRVGQSFAIDADQYIEVPDNPNLHIPQNITIEAWVNPSTSSGDRVILSKGNSDIGDGWHMMLREDNRLAVHARYGGAWEITQTLDTIETGTWHHVAYTYDGSQATLYIDGVFRAARSFSDPIEQNSRPLKIGTVDQNAYFLIGLVDEVAIYNSVLSESELNEQYQNGMAGMSYCEPVSQNQPPLAEAGGPYMTVINQPVTLDASASSDPDADPLSYDWDLDNNGEYNDANGVTATASFGQPGEYTVGLRVTDPLGLTGSDTATITVNQPAPIPHFGIWPAEDHLNGSNWLPNSTIQVTVDDPTQGPGTEFSTSFSADEWGNIHYEFGANIDLKPGFLVTVNDGVSTKEQVIASLIVTGADTVTNTVYGTSNADAVVNIWACGSYCANRHETVSPGGNWSANFAAPGDETDEQDTFDLLPGLGSDANQSDEDGDFTQIHWRISNPTFGIWLPEEHLNGSDWLPSTPVLVSVDDPANGSGTDFSATFNSDEWGNIHYEFVDTDLKPGFLVTVDDGQKVKYIVTNLVVTGANADTDAVYGTASPGAQVDVGYLCDEHGCAFRRVYADGDGKWMADFSIAGEDSDEQDLFNIRPGTGNEARQCDGDGECVHHSWRIPNPTFGVWQMENYISGWDWAHQATVQVTAGSCSASTTSDDWGNFYINFWGICILQPSDPVTVTDGVTTKAHPATNLFITNADPVTDTVYGTASPGLLVHIWGYDNNGYAIRHEIADTSGTWMANFALPGDEPDEQSMLDLQVGVSGGGSYNDEDGDHTQIYWYVPNPVFGVWPMEDELHGTGWLPYAPVQVTVDDPVTPLSPDFSTTLRSGGNGQIDYDLGADIDLKPGFLVTVSNGDLLREQVIGRLTVTDTNPQTNTVSGTGDPGVVVNVSACGDSCVIRHETVDAGGNWTANFTVPGNEPDEQTTLDLWPGSSGEVSQIDEDGDYTQVRWQMAVFGVWPGYHHVYGEGWLPNAQIEITVDDPYTETEADFSFMVTSDAGGRFYHWFDYAINIKPGFIVTVDDGMLDKEQTIPNLNVTGMNPYTDIIYGVTSPGAVVSMWFCGNSGCADRHETANETGNWTMNFAVAGDEPDEQGTFDLLVGTCGNANQKDEDGDYVQVNWCAPSIRIWPDRGELNGSSWLPHAPITVTVDDPSTGLSPDFSDTFMSDDGGNFNYGFGTEIDLQPGLIVTVDDGLHIARELTIANLAVTDTDVDADRVFGTSAPNTLVHIFACGSEGCANRYETADSAGNWIANFAIPGDETNEQDTINLLPGSSGDVEQSDEDGDFLQIHWRVPNPSFGIWLPEKQLIGWGWPSYAPIRVAVDDPATGAGEDFAITLNLDEGGYVNYTFGAEINLRPDTLITLTSGEFVHEQVIPDLAVTGFDTDLELLFGTAPPNSLVTINNICDEYGCAWRRVTTDGTGNWQADYSTPGQSEDEQTTFDLRPNVGSYLSQSDSDGDITYVRWHITNSMFGIWLPEEQLIGWDWFSNRSVDITVDDPETGPGVEFSTTVTSDQWGNIHYEFQGHFDLKPGFIVSISDGARIKQQVVTRLTARGDASTDIVSGITEPFSRVDLWYCQPGGAANCSSRQAVADADGIWMENFALPGDGPGEGNTLDLQPGSYGNARQTDEDGDYTYVGWRVPNSNFGVWLAEDHVNGWDWLPQATIQVMAGSCSTSTTSDQWGNFNLVLWQVCDLQPGDTVTVNDGTITKEHVVTALAVTRADAETDMVHGTAAPGSIANVWACGNNGCINRHETADTNGDWTANFAVPGDEPDEQGTFDLTPGYGNDANQKDDDGDFTQIHWNVPNPTFSVRLRENEIHAYQWPLGVAITLTIDDPATPQPIDYTDTRTVGAAGWDPKQTYVQFRPSDEGFSIRSGMTVTMSDGHTVKTHTVTNLVVTNIDPDMDTVTGLAAPGTQVDIGHMYCDPNGCRGFRRVFADSNGNWVVDFAHVGEDSDEQDLFDIRSGSSSEARQCDQYGECTTYSWHVSDPRMDVSYEHNWIQIRDFTPGGQVTYTIYDQEGGHALFGPVTGPVDSHGNGWISSNLHHTDLIPGNVVTAVDETTSEEVSVLIRELNLDYVGVEDDRVFGTAEPNTTIQLYINETQDQGFNLTTDVDGSGHWEVDLAAEGYPINSYRHAGANLCDSDGDCITAQPPRLHAEISQDNFGVDNFSKNGDVTLTLYDSPGGAVLYGPVMLRSDGSGNAWVSFWETGIDLVPGYYIVAHDHVLNFTKSLEIEPFDFIEMNAAEDYVSGTAAVGEWVDLHVESLFSNWGLSALADENGEWFRDYGMENYDITDQMWANGWATDDQNNWSEDHTTGLPGMQVSIAEDWISGYNFSPDRQVRIRIYAAEGGTALRALSADPLADIMVTVWGDTQFYVDYWQHGVDLQAGMYIIADDIETGKSSALTLVPLTFDGVDYDADTAWGTAGPNAQVVVRANHVFESHEVPVMADDSGNWFADFSPYDADLTPEWDLQAMVFDSELDTTVANAPRPPEITASINDDWVNGNYWTADDFVSIRIFDHEDGSLIAGPFTSGTDNHGSFYMELRNRSVDLLPGNYITVTDNVSGIIKELALPNLTIDYMDTERDVAGGTAPADTRLSLDFNNQQEGIQFDLFSETDGTWEADFAAHDFDLEPGTSGSISILDPNGDTIQVNGYIPNPAISVRAYEDYVEGWEWTFGSTVTIEVYEQAEQIDPVYTDTATVGIADWDPNQTWFGIYTNDYDLKVGDIVEATDGNITKQLVVTDFTITDVDTDNDIVSGKAGSSQRVNVWTCWQNDPCINREVIADQNGNWSENFGVPGNQDWEQETADLQPGSWVDSSVNDEDGDAVMFGWYVYSYTLHAVPARPEVHGHEWRSGADITLIIDNDTDPDNGILYTVTKNPDDDPWCGYPCFDLAGVFELQAGQYVTMMDGLVSRTVQVSTLQITEVNREDDTISGIADPGSLVAVDIASQDDKTRHVTTDASGHWVANFSVFGDEDFEQFTTDLGYGDNGSAIQLISEGIDDGTVEYWNIDWVAPDWIPLVSALTYSPDLNRPAYDTDTWTLTNLLWQPLFRSTNQDTLMPASATGYVISPDGLTYTITLRDDIYWSDGQPVTAQHFVDGFLRLLAPDTASDYASLLFDIQGAREYSEGSDADPNDVGLAALGDHTLQITLAHPAVYFPQILAIAGMIPTRLDIIAQYGDAWTEPGNFVGNGPYLLLEKDNGHILLQKNPYYQNAQDLAFDHIAFDIIADVNEQFNAYQRGEIDVVVDASGDALTDPNYQLEQFASELPGTIFLRLDVQDSPTDNLLVRRALAAAIDRREILDNVLNTPWAQDATGLIPPSLPGYQGANVGYTYNPLIAQSLLADAGYPNGEGLPTVHIYGRPPHQPLLEAIAAQWESVLGITVQVHSTDQNLMEYMRQCGDSATCIGNGYRLGWIMDYFDAHNMLNDFFHPDSGFPNGGWDSARYRELIELSMAEQDPVQRIAYLQEAEQLLVEDDAVVIPLYFTDRVSLIKPGFNPAYGLIPYFDLWNVASTNQPPDADAGPDQATFINNTIILDASASSDPDGDVLTFEWDLDNDGAYDDASGITATTSFNQTGDHVIGLQVTDSGGLSDTDTVTIAVEPWTLTGFYQPVDMNGIYNLVKGGSTVPFKFEIFAGSIELTSPSFMKSFAYVQISCEANALTDQIETVVTGISGLRYDSLAGQFIYNWKTPANAGKCYRVTMTTMDDSSLVAYFKLK